MGKALLCLSRFVNGLKLCQVIRVIFIIHLLLSISVTIMVISSTTIIITLNTTGHIFALVVLIAVAVNLPIVINYFNNQQSTLSH